MMSYLEMMSYPRDDVIPLSVMAQFSRLTEAAGGGGGGSAEGLDVNELSQKLATIPVDDAEEGGDRPFISENSSTAAIFGSEGGRGGSKQTYLGLKVGGLEVGGLKQTYLGLKEVGGLEVGGLKQPYLGQLYTRLETQ